VIFVNALHIHLVNGEFRIIFDIPGPSPKIKEGEENKEEEKEENPPQSP